MDELCKWCRLVEPVSGYICAFCVFDELNRIRQLDVAESKRACEALDREQYGFVMSPQEHLEAAERSLERLRETLKRMGAITDGV